MRSDGKRDLFKRWDFAGLRRTRTRYRDAQLMTVTRAESKLRVVFLQRQPLEKLGIMYLAAIVRRRGHLPFAFLDGAEKDLLSCVVEAKPDLVALSATTGSHRWAIGTAARIKSRLRTTVVLGGPHASYSPEVIEQGPIDVVCRGEGERAMEGILSRMEVGGSLEDLENLWVKQDGRISRNGVGPLIEDLDGIPFPDREVYCRYRYLMELRAKPVLSGRGCGCRCTFCHNALDLALYEGKGTWVRKRSPRNILEEIREIRRRYRLDMLHMDRDDHFLIDRAWSFRFLEEYASEVRIPFAIQSRAEAIDRPVADALRQARCASVALSVETADEEMRNRLLGKRISFGRVVEAVELLKQRQIFVKIFNMIGLPGESFAGALATIQMNIRLHPDFARCSLAVPYPGTEFFRQCVDAGLIPADFSPDGYYEGYFQQSILQVPESTRIANLQKFFTVAVSFPWLMPLVKLLVRLPPNALFNRLYQASACWCAKKCAGLRLKDAVALVRYSPKGLPVP